MFKENSVDLMDMSPKKMISLKILAIKKNPDGGILFYGRFLSFYSRFGSSVIKDYDHSVAVTDVMSAPSLK